MKKFIFVFLSVLFFFACQKEKPAPIPDPCENAYELRSKPYTNIYQGELPVCPIENKYIYPDKNHYTEPILNPKNEFEFCYIKKNIKANTRDLYKYNFCTNSATLVVEAIYSAYDWSVKDWIIFTKGNNVWKIKSNGDSLVKLNLLYKPYSIWSPSGNKYINGNKILNEDGKFLEDVALAEYSFLWETDSTLFHTQTIANEFTIYRYELKTKKKQFLFSTKDSLSYVNLYSPKYSCLYIKNSESGKKNKYLKIDTKSWQSTKVDLLENNKNHMFYFNNFLNNRLLGSVISIDTLTGKPCSVNYRQHITLMNLDGTNERQVLLPE